MINTHVPKAQRETAEYYDQFVEKFKLKKTSDDCYTPESVYNAVRDWAIAEYDIAASTRIIRPFWPGGDYQSEDYYGDCVVIDNPPFSIITNICRWYMQHGVRFFLFAPHLTLFDVAAGEANYIVCDALVTYGNGAKVKTSFVTNMGDDKIYCAPNLERIIYAAHRHDKKSKDVKHPRYEYPVQICTPSRLGVIISGGMELHIKKHEAQFLRALDAQRAHKKAIFGGGFLLSEKAAAEKAAAEKAAAEKAAAEKWELSEREIEIVKKLGMGEKE